MAVDSVQLVKDQLEPVLLLDTTIEAAIPRQVEAQIALQGWTASSLTEGQKVYVSLLALRMLVPRLLLKFIRMVETAKGGPAEVTYQSAVDFLKALQAELKQQVQAAAHEVAPEDEEKVEPARSPQAGVRGW